MTLAWFGCDTGASGDMFLGALVDAGAPLEVLQSAVDAVGVEPVRLSRREVTRAGLMATQVRVRAPRSDAVRTWAGVRGLLETADLAEPVRTRALDVFARLALAEAAAHRVPPDQVHFHEVGALDAIADVVGSCAGLHALGVASADASPVALGSGTVRGEHGLLPVPVPAVLALLADADAPVYAGPVPHELCTPTGAALLAATVTRWGGLPPMRIRATGTGAGERDHVEAPNVLRLVLGDTVADRPDGSPVSAPVDATVGTTVDTARLLEANVDDLDPRIWPAVLAALLTAGASDAWLTPILMKKGRPAHTLSVLTTDRRAADVRRAIFTESSTIGLREHRVVKHALVREVRSVSVDGVGVTVKVALLGGEVVNVAPEYDDVAAAAAQLGRPVKAVLAAAVAAAQVAL